MALWLIIATVFVACNNPSADNRSADNPATIYHNGDIITMQGDRPQYASAVVEKDGVIAFVGAYDEAVKKFGAGSRQVDLEGKTLLPGFIDGHGHLYNTGMLSLTANVLPPPDGPGADFDELVTTIKAWMETADGKYMMGKMGWIMANGYDDSQLKEKQHPSKDVLDKISTEMPVVVIHQSGHLACVNSKALEIFGYDKNTKDIEGGVIRRYKNGEPNGVLEEAAYFNALLPILLKKTDSELQLKSVQKGQEEYAKQGYLTAQDGRSTSDVTSAFQFAAKENKFFIDVVAYPDIVWNKAAVTNDYYNNERRYINLYRIGGVKLTLDGSPQGKTAWLTKCYHVNPDGKQGCYEGYAIMSVEKATEYITTAFANKWQILCHTNGDAAIDQFIHAVSSAVKTNGYPDHRSVMIHGQTLRKDQIPELVRLQILPSLFPMHTYYWGDWHRESVLGEERAAYISPTRDVRAAGLTLTSQHDAPVTFPNALRVLDATVNRTTRSNFVLGPDQRLTPYEGLKTLTEWAAIQYFEEDKKGTLEEGKLADFVILGQNPLKIDPSQINAIRVLESIKEGVTVFKLDDASVTFAKASTQVTGAWSETAVDDMVIAASEYAVSQMNTKAKLKKVLSARKQVVKGLNFDITYELDNGSVWQAIVYRDLQGKHSFLQQPLEARKAMAGGWSETTIDQVAKDAASFMVSRMNTNAKLKKVLSVKKQIVKGTNYDLTFELDNGSTWRGIVNRGLKGDFSVVKNAEKQ